MGSVRVRLNLEREAREQHVAELEKNRPAVEAAQRKAAALKKYQDEGLRAFWGQPLEETRGKGGTTFAIDEGLNVPNGKTTRQGLDAGRNFFDSLSAKTGYVLSPEGRDRVIAYAYSQSFHGKDFSTEDAWMTAFSRLRECRVFAFDELSRDMSKKTYIEPDPVTPGPTYDDLIKVDAGTQEGLSLARHIADQLYDKEALPIMHEWIKHLMTKFDFVPTEDQINAALAWFKRNDHQSLLDRRAYDACRRAMVTNFVFPESCLTQDERDAQAIEQMDVTRMGFEERQRLARQLQR